MRKLVYVSRRNNTSMLELEVDVIYFRDTVEASSILDINDPAFLDFEADIMSACELHDFELEDSYQSDDENSISQYYIYVKTDEDGSKLKVFLKIRISDHIPPMRAEHGELLTYDERDSKYTKQKAKEYAEMHFNQPRGYRIRRINIIFNDDNYTSYEKALQAIESKLDEFDPE